MVEENKDLEIENIENTEEGVEVDIGEGEQVTPEQSVDELKAQVEKANRERDEAKQRAEQAEVTVLSTVQQAKINNIAVQEEKIASDELAIQEQIKDLRRQKKEARESGDIDAEDEVDEKLAEARFKAQGIKSYKDQLSRYKESVINEPKPRDPDAAWTMDDIKDYSPKAREWIGEHKEYLTDKSFRDRATKAHYLAGIEGIKDDTPEYFAFIEEKLGLSGDGKKQAEPKARQASSVRPGAPPSRGGSNESGGGRFVRLTPAQREAAEICGMTDVEYAKYLEDEKKSGKN
jgi:chromosome segregation ATPase